MANEIKAVKYTPGPWKIGEAIIGEGYDIPVLADDSGECLIATVESENADMAETVWADARLIAAAPDMAELLGDIRAMLESSGLGFPKLIGRIAGVQRKAGLDSFPPPSTAE